MDMSLDDIIKTKKIGKNLKTTGTINKKPIRKPSLALKTAAAPRGIRRNAIVDARLKIIQKNRAKIHDARDKLAELTRLNGDARKKLVRKQLATDSSLLKPLPARFAYRSLAGRMRAKKEAAASYYYEPPMQLPIPPRGYVDYDNMNDMEEDELESATRLSRTVKNDMASFGSKRGNGSASSRDWSSNEHFDPFDVYEVQSQPRLERRIATNLHDLPPPPLPKGILRSARQSHRDDYDMDYLDSPSHLSYEMRSRLERAPDPHASMGIFANPLKQMSPPPSGSSSQGYRIVVSNLHTNVTQQDIKELFEDIGELYDSRIVRPGVAEVIYKKLSDAENAVDTYHNRQLDGQPMKCLLVNPRSSNKPTAPAIKLSSNSNSGSSSGNKTPLEIDIDALHKVLFRRQ